MHRFLGLFVFLAFCFPGVSNAAAKPLNVVLVLVDDLGWMDLSCQGSQYYETPHIDRLAAEGMRFTDGYAACAVCSPTRAAVMTGRYPGRTYVTDWIRSRFQGGNIPEDKVNPFNKPFTGGGKRLMTPRNALWLESAEITVAEMLKPKGYVSCHIGKWHLGADEWYPQKQGFDYNFGGCDYGQPPSYFDPYNQKNGRHPMTKAGIPHLPSRKVGEYLTDREGDEAVGFIQKHKNDPFFLFLAHYAVHTPIQARKDLTEKYEAKPKTEQKNAKYAAMVHSVDDAMGKVLQTLDELKLSENTLVIFTSDNGGLSGPTHNAPLRSGKGYPFEGGIRVPWIVKWPGVTKPGSVSSVPISSVDIFPTIAQAAGIPLPKDRAIDGLDLKPVLEGGDKLEREDLFWHFPHYRHGPGPYSIVRHADWKLIKWYAGPQYALFNLTDDLGEKKDLAASMPEKVKALDTILVAHLKDIKAKVPFAGEAEAQKIPRVLIIGDSISIGYTKPLKDLLKGKVEIVHNKGNAGNTGRGLENIDKWIGDGKWDLIHFNWGLWDLCHRHPDSKNQGKRDKINGTPMHTIEEYEKNLTQLVKRLKKTKAKLLWASTTPVPEHEAGRKMGDDLKYNAVAAKIMKANNIPINDLHRFILPQMAQHQTATGNVHFKPEGSKLLAQQTAKEIQKALQ